MLILTLRTDKPEAEIGLYDNEVQLEYEVWHAHRQLAETIHTKLTEVLQNTDKELQDIQGIVMFKGPGSFTGLRIGASVADALAYSLDIPIVGVNDGDNWQTNGIQRLRTGENDKIISLEYGSPARTTQQKK